MAAPAVDEFAVDVEDRNPRSGFIAKAPSNQGLHRVKAGLKN